MSFVMGSRTDFPKKRYPEYNKSGNTESLFLSIGCLDFDIEKTDKKYMITRCIFADYYSLITS